MRGAQQQCYTLELNIELALNREKLPRFGGQRRQTTGNEGVAEDHGAGHLREETQRYEGGSRRELRRQREGEYRYRLN